MRLTITSTENIFRTYLPFNTKINSICIANQILTKNDPLVAKSVETPLSFDRSNEFAAEIRRIIK
jgi:hypothetical protein